jgi:hypothetical protein
MKKAAYVKGIKPQEHTLPICVSAINSLSIYYFVFKGEVKKLILLII